MAKATLIVMVGVVLLAFGAGVGAGSTLNAVGVLGPNDIIVVTQPLSERERFRQCSMSEAVPSPEAMEGTLTRWTLRNMRAATPAWPAP